MRDKSFLNPFTFKRNKGADLYFKNGKRVTLMLSDDDFSEICKILFSNIIRRRYVSDGKLNVHYL